MNSNKTFITGLALVIAFNFILLWFGGSVITSTIKALTDSCGKRYEAEIVFGGDWFCPTQD